MVSEGEEERRRIRRIIFEEGKDLVNGGKKNQNMKVFGQRRKKQLEYESIWSTKEKQPEEENIWSAEEKKNRDRMGENIWRRKVFGQWRGGKTEREKEDYIWRRKRFGQRRKKQSN